MQGAKFRRVLPRVRLRTRARVHLAVLQRRTNRSIATIQAGIGQLTARITTLESRNADKERQASELVAAIDQRRAQLRQSRDGKGFFSALGLLGSIATGGMGAPLFLGGMVLAARDGGPGRRPRVASAHAAQRARRPEPRHRIAPGARARAGAAAEAALAAALESRL